ncbi:MAG: hypothetical protein Q8P67_14085, partial [archaeon]|nr:hypothetical protein [archaeon]
HCEICDYFCPVESSVLDPVSCSCFCQHLYTGEKCTQCKPELWTCQHNGTFVNQPGTCACHCPPINGAQYWGGDLCEICVLSEHDCENKGVPNLETCECECEYPWIGEFCEICDRTEYLTDCRGRNYNPETCECLDCTPNTCADVPFQNFCTEDVCLPNGFCDNPKKDCSALAKDEEFPECWVTSCPGTDGHCEISPASAGTLCFDGDLCTINDVCDGSGFCSGGPKPCNQSDACNLQECVDGECVVPHPIVCADTDPCTLDVCNPNNASCSFIPDPLCLGCFSSANCTTCSQTSQCVWLGCNQNVSSLTFPPEWADDIKFWNASQLGFVADSIAYLENLTSSQYWLCIPKTLDVNLDHYCDPETCVAPPPGGLTAGEVAAIATLTIIIPLIAAGIAAAAIIIRCRARPEVLLQSFDDTAAAGITDLVTNPLHVDDAVITNALNSGAPIGPV